MKKLDGVTTLQLILLAVISLLLMGATTMTDPTRPPNIIFSPKTYATSQPLELTAVFIYPTYRFAVISGQIVKPGDRLDQFTITRINAYTVELTGSQNNVEVLQLTVPVKQEVR